MPEPTRMVVWDIDQIKLARNNLDGTFGTAVQAKAAAQASIEMRIKSGELMGDGGLYAVASKLIAANFTFNFGDLLEFETVEIIVGDAAAESGTSPAATYFNMRKRNYPVFGLAARAFDSTANHTFHIFAPMCQVTQNFQMGFRDGEFLVPEIQGVIVEDPKVQLGGNPVVMVPFYHDTTVTLTLPPSTLPLVFG